MLNNYNNLKTGVAWEKPAVRKLKEIYTKISDALEGEYVVKRKREEYLPDPSGLACPGLEREIRYARFLNDAIFVNYSRKTLSSLSGLAYQNPVAISLPEELESLQENASGSGGQSLEAQSKEALELVIAFGRCGVLVDFSNDSGDLRPTLTLYRPEQIINWRIQDVGTQEVLSLLVLQEVHSVAVGDYEEEDVVCFREYRVEDTGVVTHRLHIPKKNGADFEIVDERLLLNSVGKPLEKIPFIFANETGNEADKVTIPEFYNLVTLNFAHYCAFADYQEMCHLLGQQSLKISGLTDDWVETHLSKGFEFGSRSALLLPEGGNADVISAKENGLAAERLTKIENEMVKIGARIAEKTGGNRTATEASLENISETSTLISCVRSVSGAYKQALKIACNWVGIPDDVEFEISTNYDLAHFTISDAPNIANLLALGALDISEVRLALQKIGLATLTQEEFESKKKEQGVQLDDFAEVFDEEEGGVDG